MYGFVYKITNILDRKVYVGQTTQTLKNRFMQHYYSDSPLGKAMHQQGLENFKIEVITECNSKEELDEQESLNIRKMGCMVPRGYNQTGGNNHYSERISLALTPATYDGIKTLADIKGLSVNDLLNSVADELVKKNAATIAEYEKHRTRLADSLNLSVAMRDVTIDTAPNV